MQLGTLQKIVQVLAEAFEALHAEMPCEEVERLAILIHRAMTVPARNYHTPEHVFKFLDPADPVQNLAALFHDIIYYQVDMGILPEIWVTLAPYLAKQDDRLFIAAQLPPDDRLLGFLLDLFDLQAGQEITSVPALSEFLSALEMIKRLTGLVPEKDLIRMTVCIEATIPFRGSPVSDECYHNSLENRLRAICEKRQMPLTDPEIETIIRWAVNFANKDIDSFAEDDPGKFLDGTWKLLPETNVALRFRQTYSLRDYRQALQKMEAFLSSLNPNRIFSCYRGVPEPQVFEHMINRAHQNIAIAREYLRLKWLAIAVLEALAEVSGGDAPLSLFMGDMPKGDAVGLEDLLPEVDLPAWVDVTSPLYKLLAIGRVEDTSFDIKNSPLTLFLYKSLPPDKIKRMLAQAREMFANRLLPEDFLAQIDHPVVTAVAGACATLIYTRRERLLPFTF